MIATDNPETVSLNASDIASYLEVVFGYTSGLVPIRILAEKGMPSGPAWTEFADCGDGLLQALLRQARRAVAAERALYVVPGTVARRGTAKADDILEMSVVLVDLDNGDIVANHAHLVKHLGAPTLEVASGGKTESGQDKLHLYWRLTEAARGDDVKRIARVRAAIAAKAGGDCSFDSPHQPIRVAGSIHSKYGRKSSVRIIARSRREYDLTEFEDAVSSMPPSPTSLPVKALLAYPGRNSPHATDTMTQLTHEGGVDSLNRFQAISSVTGHWIRNVRNMRATLDGAWSALVDYNTAMIVPPWPEDRLRQAFDALIKRDIVNHGPLVSREDLPNGRSFAPDQSEDAIAAEFAALHQKAWRHVPIWGAWFNWNGGVWQKDSVAGVREEVRQTCRSVAGRNDKPNEARRIASDKTIAAVLRIASSDPCLTSRTEDWDADPMILNCTAGFVDLESGEIARHSSEALITRIAPASGSGACPGWKVFIDEITGGDAELAAYIKRVCAGCAGSGCHEPGSACGN